MTVLVLLTNADDGESGIDQAQPPGVSPVLAPVMRQLQDGAILNQVRDVPLPVRPLPGLTVAGQEHGERPVLDPDADRVVVLVLVVLGRLRHHRQDDRPQFDLAGAGRGEDRRYAAVTDQTEQFQVIRGPRGPGSSGSGSSGRVDLGGRPPRPPTDPGLHITRTRFLIS